MLGCNNRTCDAINPLSRYNRAGLGSQLERAALHYKKILLIINFSCILASLYCYWRHNTYCEPGMYSTFSMFEYTVVLTNMAFHATSYYDFYNVNLSLNSF